MGEVVAREVEVVSNPSVPVVSHGAPVLSTSLSTRSCVAHLPHILRWFSLAGSRPVRAGDGIAHIGIFTGDVLPNRPGLACQGAGVCLAVAGVDAAQAPHLAALLEPCLQPPTSSLPPVNLRQFCSHQNISEVGRPKVRDHGRPRHPLLHLWVSLNKKFVMLSKDPRRIWESSIEGMS